MSKCLYCEGPVETNQKTGQPRKYCSKKCTQKFYTKTGRYNKHKKPGSDWGSKTIKRKEEQAKRREVYQWYCENWLTTKQVAELIGMTAPAVHNRAKANNVNKKVVSPGTTNGSPTAFWDPEDLGKLKQLKNDDIPEGMLTAEEAAEMVGYTLSSFNTIDKSGLKKLRATKNGIHRVFYDKEEVKIWWKKFQENRDKKVERRKEESERRKQEKQKKIQEEKKAEEERLLLEREQMSKLGLMDLDAVEKKLGWATKGVNWQRHVKSGRWSEPVKAGGTLWFKPEEVEEYHEWQNRERKPKLGLVKRDDDYTSAESYEKRLFERKFPFWLKMKPEKKDSILINKRYKKNHEIGLTKKLKCNKCLQQLPYFDFTYANSLRGRAGTCRSCVKKATAARPYDPNVQKQQRANNHIQRFRSLISTQIKTDMSLATGTYQDLMGEEIWHHIETTLGYNAKTFCDHLESLFTPQMNWKNHARDSKGFRWEVDHIIPRCKLQYDSLKHPNFAKCWDLSNIRPLEWRANNTKASK